ncbi:hypothetical protein JXQ70_02395 [bacterium]|nr:hypothetical protein [bacterium]
MHSCILYILLSRLILQAVFLDKKVSIHVLIGTNLVRIGQCLDQQEKEVLTRTHSA